jgi:hypothetical protein
LIFLSFLTMCNTSSFLTWSVQLIFSSLLQHHVSELPSYLRPTLWSVPSFSTIWSCTPNVALY